MTLFIKNLLFTLFIPGTVAVYLPLTIARGSAITVQPLLLACGIVLLATGAAGYAWTVWDFARFGKGTPLPIDAPKKLVIRGLYRYTRNPMYLGVFLVILSWACLFANGWLLLYFTGVAVIVQQFVVGYEEPKLEKTFGEDYLSYKSSVRRWIPGRGQRAKD